MVERSRPRESVVVVVVVHTVEQTRRVYPGTDCEMQLIRGSQTPLDESRASAPLDKRPDDGGPRPVPV